MLFRSDFPKIPGVAVATRPMQPYDLDFSAEPPALGEPYAKLLPRVDPDGNEPDGIRLPSIQVPLATYTGWNLRSPEIGAPDEMYSLVGSYIPFARTKAEREKKGDPRRSIEERYTSRQEYLRKVEAAARNLAGTGFLLEQDIPKLVERGAAEWDWTARPR